MGVYQARGDETPLGVDSFYSAQIYAIHILRQSSISDSDDGAFIDKDPGVFHHSDGPLGLPALSGTAQGGGQDADVGYQQTLHHASSASRRAASTIAPSAR